MVCTTANWVRLQTWVVWSGGGRPSILDSNIKLTLISHLRIVRAIAANIFICTRYHWRNNENEMKIKTNYGSFHDDSHTLVVRVRHIVMRTRSHLHRTNCSDCDNMTALPTYYCKRNNEINGCGRQFNALLPVDASSFRFAFVPFVVVLFIFITHYSIYINIVEILRTIHQPAQAHTIAMSCPMQLLRWCWSVSVVHRGSALRIAIRMRRWE